ncbi:hypothetical protein, partial [Mesorhizobium sp. B264B1A]|uniref:hypothetical protein n=1 Tax=Mesorhizobium sp. B264B1A TaxID=2876668 RepID=UPI001CCC43FD
MDQTSDTREWGESDGLQFFGRHLVAICVTYRLVSASKQEALSFAAYNGTLIDSKRRLLQEFLAEIHPLAVVLNRKNDF